MEISGGKHKIKILNKLGKGAWGEVFRCLLDGEMAACKTVLDDGHGHGSCNEEDIAFKMFMREAQILQACNHGRITGFKALCRLNTDKGSKKQGTGKWALVLEFAKGGTLSDKVSQCMISPGSKVYSDAQALSWALDVATALEYLHLRSPAVYHRDVKPGNIVLVREEGQWVAKLGDFGLHVVADNTRDRLLRVSFSCGPNAHTSAYYTTNTASAPATPRGTAAATAGGGNGSRSGGWCELTQQHVQALQQQLMQEKSAAGAAQSAEAAAAAAGGAKSCFDKDSARTAMGRLSSAGNKADHQYGEMHDSSGSYPFRCLAIRTHSSPVFVPLPGDSSGEGAASYAASAGAAAGAAARAWRRAGPRRSVSFNITGRQNVYTPAGAAMTEGDDADAAAKRGSSGVFTHNYAKWVEQCGGFAVGRSMSSMLTDATWVSNGTALTNCTSSDDAASWTQVETVFNMTGQTGSCLYMSPEVFKGQPYNEKADVFSFGVVLYELMARCLLIFTELPTNSSDPALPERYAAQVSGGYRPPRPKRMPPAVWQLIEACWHQEPTARPSMSKVVRDLQLLLREEEMGGGSGAPNKKSSFSFNARPSFSANTTNEDAHSDAHQGQLPSQVDGQQQAGGSNTSSQASTAGSAAAGAAAVPGVGPDSSAPAPGCACVIS